MQRNDGRSLEQLVSVIESRLVPQGFQVELRERVYNDSGIQIAEFDILITGRVGSMTFSWLIECRDRPSEGAAPAQWIEQLIGRQRRFRFDKVMAVSSTGFCDEAIKVAADANIELRHLDELTPEAIGDWLPQNAPLIIRDGQPVSVRLSRSTSEPDTETCQTIPTDQPILLNRSSHERISVLDLWEKLIHLNSVWHGVSEGGPPVETTIVASDHIADSFAVELDGSLQEVECIEFKARLHAYSPLMPLVEGGAYSSVASNPEHKRTYARLGRWKGPENGPIKEMLIIGYTKDPCSSGQDH